LLDPASADIARARKGLIAARQHLAGGHNLPYAAPILAAFESFEWNDASLGCPEPGMMYDQAVAPGFMMAFVHKSQTYEYHTNLDGSLVVACSFGPPQTTPPSLPGVFFIRQDESIAPRETMAALLVGRLVAADGCMRVIADDGSTSYLPVWPPRFEMRIEAGSVDLTDSAGNVVAQVGDTIRIDGGEIGATESLDANLQRKLTETHCQGPYWVVGEQVDRADAVALTQQEIDGNAGKPVPPGSTGLITETDAVRMDAQSYADDMGVDIEEAMRRLALQDPIGQLNATLAAQESDTFAGLWVEHDPDYKVVVLFTRNGEETIRPYIQDTPIADIVEVRGADATLLELSAAQSEASGILEAMGVAANSAVDVQRNRVEIWTTDAASLNRTLADAGWILPKHVEVTAVDALAVPAIGPEPEPPVKLVVPTARPLVGSLDNECQQYHNMLIEANGQTAEAVVTYHRCGPMYVDSTGRSPSATPAITVPSDDSLTIRLRSANAPTFVEVRSYAGTGKYGSFGRWPEDLPGGDAPLDIRQPEPSSEFEYDPPVSAGDYSLVIWATWTGASADVFYATSVRVE
tara:strand:+ start:1802 stop:3532 length:1731 start_codon:yes stop_codon:yes gene_type:complete